MTYTTIPARMGHGLLFYTYLELVIGRDETSLVLKSTSTGDEVLASFPLGPYELFRPDGDAHFTSRNGRHWRPE